MRGQPPWLPSAAALLVLALTSGCASHALSKARTADDLRDYDVAVAQYSEALRRQPNNQEAREGLQRAKLRASDAHLLQGRRLFSQGRFDESVVELQLASELNPLNAPAEADLRAVRAALRARLASSPESATPLESLLSRMRDAAPVTLELPDVKLPAQIATGSEMTRQRLYLMLARLADISVTFDAQFQDGPAQVSLLSNMTLRQALDAIAKSTQTFYRVTGPNTILVLPDNPGTRREYTDEVVRVLVVQNADLKETMDALRVVLDARSLSQITGTNMIVMRDTPERVAAAARFVSAFDKARPEVVVNVEVLEVNRTRLRELSGELASAGAGTGGSEAATREALQLNNLKSLTAADVLTTNIPALYYRLLKTDDRTRTLANPHLRIVDGTTASANFGEDVPVPKQTIVPITQTGVNIQPQTTFEYRTVGVNIGITPRTHANDEVTLGLNIELSSLAGAGFDGLPKFGKRSIQTSIRLRDGQTNVLAGLIREDERWTKETIFGIGDLPILGSLFARNRREAQQTDVIIMLTPHIVRLLDITEYDLRPFTIPRDGSGGGDLGPIVPPPTGRGGGGGR